MRRILDQTIPLRRRSRCWRYRYRILERASARSWSCRSGWPTKDAIPAAEKARRAGMPTAPSTRSAIALAGRRSDTARSRSGRRAPSPTRSANLPKRTCEIEASTVRDVRLKFLKPGARVAVGGCAPVAARRQRAAGRDLRAVRHGGALELAEAEEALEEDAEPALDRREVVGAAAVFGKAGRPFAPCFVAPGMKRQERDLRRTEAVARRVEEVEVLQLVGADRGFRALRRLARDDGDKLRCDLRAEDRVRASRPLPRRTGARKSPSGSNAGSASSARRN